MVPDYGSRNPCGAAKLFLDDHEVSWIEDVEVSLHDTLMQAWDKSEVVAVSWPMVRQATLADGPLSVLKNVIEDGINDARFLPPELTGYTKHMHKIWIQDDVLVMGNRTIIPPRLRQRILNHLIQHTRAPLK